MFFIYRLQVGKLQASIFTVTKCILEFKECNLQLTICNLQLTFCDLQATNFYLSVKSCRKRVCKGSLSFVGQISDCRDGRRIFRQFRKNPENGPENYSGRSHPGRSQRYKTFFVVA
jgi:hypothetical protein